MKEATLQIFGTNKNNEMIKSLFFWRLDDVYLSVWYLKDEQWQLLGTEVHNNLVYVSADDIQAKMRVKCSQLLKGLE